MRTGAYAMGVLVSNDVQDVIIEEGVVQISPTSEDQIAIPDYDGFALLGALEPAAVDSSEDVTADASEDTAAVVPQPRPAEAEMEADAETEIAAAEDLAETEPPPTEPVAADPYAQGYVEPDPGYAYAAPAAPAYVEPPVYASAPPPVAYSQPSGSFWGSTATFVGGAAVGSILGYALSDDDDDDSGDRDERRNDVNIEDSTVIVGDQDRFRLDQDDRDRVNAQLRGRRDRGEGIQGRDRDRSVAALPGRNSQARQREPRRDISLPQRDRERPAKIERRQAPAVSALKAPTRERGAAASIQRPSQAKKEASRGKSSRLKSAALKAKTPQRQTVQRTGGQSRAASASSGGKLKALAPKGGNKKAKASSKRGKKSRGNKRRG